IQNGPP
ncbi:hypothetical protein ECPA49_5701, partial [Escherichia coli PA49]